MSEHWTPVLQLLYPEEYEEYLQRQADFRFKMEELFPIPTTREEGENHV